MAKQSLKRSPAKPSRIQRLAAEQQRLYRAKAEADALFLSIGEGALVTDSDGKVSRINQAGLDILHLEESDIVGKWYPDAVIAENENGEPIDYIDRPIAEVFMTGKPVFSKLYFRRKDDTRVPVALTVSPVLLDNKPIGAIEIFRDITQEVKLDQAKDEFISLASHQLRTPATGVKQYLTMILDGYVGTITPAQRRFIQTANQSNDRQLMIIDDILRVAAADSGNVVLNKETVDLTALIEEVMSEQATKFAKRNQTIVFEHDTEHIYATIDKNSVRMVFENLIDNAHKYTYPGKTITITMRETARAVRISIQDEGTGIAKQDIGKLFQKFNRLSNPLSVSSGGTGLGLYWVKQIITLHDGSIKVLSELGKGSTFIVSLPKQK